MTTGMPGTPSAVLLAALACRLLRFSFARLVQTVRHPEPTAPESAWLVATPWRYKGPNGSDPPSPLRRTGHRPQGPDSARSLPEGRQPGGADRDHPRLEHGLHRELGALSGRVAPRRRRAGGSLRTETDLRPRHGALRRNVRLVRALADY